mmetsp:Transcript_29590/g.87826  ORF Transcript_29590/g.87826 Transcript_29590/m.87826 type:complete len:245 (-) Transcript_29590:4596-5330(-)
MHDLVPGLARGCAEERREGEGEVLEVAVLVQRVSLLHRTEELNAQDGEEDEQQQQHEDHVDKAGQRKHQGHEDLVQLLQEPQEPEEPCDAEDADHGRDGPDVERRRFADDDAEQSGDHAEEVELVPVVPEVRAAEDVALQDGLDREGEGEEEVQPLLHIVEPGPGLGEDAQAHQHGVNHDARHDELLEVRARPVAADEVVDSPARGFKLREVLDLVDLRVAVQRLAGLLPLPLPVRQHELASVR